MLAQMTRQGILDAETVGVGEPEADLDLDDEIVAGKAVQ